MPPKQPSLQQRLIDPDYKLMLREAKFGIPLPLSDALVKRLDAAMSREKANQVSADILDINAEKKIATIKADVRKMWAVVATIGPSAEDWESFHIGVANPPPNPYLMPPPNGTPTKPRRKRRSKKEPTIDQVAEAVADAIREETGMGVEISGADVATAPADPQPAATPPSAEPRSALESFQLEVRTRPVN